MCADLGQQGGGGRQSLGGGEDEMQLGRYVFGAVGAIRAEVGNQFAPDRCERGEADIGGRDGEGDLFRRLARCLDRAPIGGGDPRLDLDPREVGEQRCRVSAG